MENALPIINALMKVLGNVTLGEAKSWLETEQNAEQLLAEGHESDGNAE